MSRILRFLKKQFPNFLILLGITIVVLSWGPLVRDELWYVVKQAKHQKYFVWLGGTTTKESSDAVKDSVFAKYISNSPVYITPVNTDFALVIEKIDVNVPIVAGVPVSDTRAYTEALRNGVAQALISDLPSDKPGNTYLFAHSSINFWGGGKYATVFNLLKKLETGDPIFVFYHNKTYRYKVINKEVVKGWNTYPIIRPVLEPLLTLQTCDPPGTTFNRLIITAKLAEITEE